MNSLRSLVGLGVVLGGAPLCIAEPYRPSVILDGQVPLPGGQPGETIGAFGPPALDGADLAFPAVTSTGSVGVYLLTPEDGLVEIVRTGSRPPGQPEGASFNILALGVTLQDQRVAFYAEWTTPDEVGGAGLYLWEKGVLRVVADSTGPALPGIGVASNFWPAFEPSGDLVFRAVHSASSMALIRETSPGNFETVIDTHSQAPWEAPGANVGRIGAVFSNERGLAMVGGADGSAQLIRRGSDGTWAALTDHLETPNPGIPGAFLFVEDILSGPPSLVGSDVAFRSRSYIPPGPLLPGAGIYRSRGGAIEVVADGSTLHPVSGLPFTPQFFSYHPSGGARHLSFRAGTADALFGIHVVNDEGDWTVLAEQGSLFAGRSVVSFGHGHQAWDGERMAITVLHPEGATIYVVDFGQPSVIEVPTLGTAALVCLALTLLIVGLARVRHRRTA